MIYTDNLQTPHLTTRFVTEADIPAWVEYCSDPVATKFTAIAGKTPEEMAGEFIRLTMKRYAEGRYGLQALISKETGEFIGMCGLLVQEVEYKKEVEIGYHLLPRYWGNGYATEAAMMFRDYGFENNVADSLISIIDPKNEPSKKVAGRIGMTLVARSILFRDSNYNIFRITRKQWETIRISDKATATN